MSYFETTPEPPSGLGLTQCLDHQRVTARPRLWTVPCYLRGVRSEQGFTLVEILIVVGLIGITAAISVPVFVESSARNRLWTASEQIGGTIRQARLKAISQNTSYRVAFDCPVAGSVRSLIMTGDALVDDAEDRCSQTLEGDSGALEMPMSVTYDPGDATAMQVSGRGVFTATGAAIPLTISVQYGSSTRTLTVSATGQITFSNIE